MGVTKDDGLTERVLSFWFDGDPVGGRPAPRELWFKPTPEFDRQLTHSFADDHERAAAGDLDRLRKTAAGCLALIVLLDQFPRNMFRGTAQAFATDGKALTIANHALDKGFDEPLAPVGRLFLYLPFEHSEALADQERSVELFKVLGNDYWIDYAVRHRDIIARFGRFPHRNDILGRVSTPEEIAFLKEPGSSF